MVIRLLPILFAAFLVSLLQPLPVQAGKYDAQFQQFLNNEIIPAARRSGVSQATLDRELAGLTPDTSLPGLVGPGGKGSPPKVNFQAEFARLRATFVTASSTGWCPTDAA